MRRSCSATAKSTTARCAPSSRQGFPPKRWPCSGRAATRRPTVFARSPRQCSSRSARRHCSQRPTRSPSASLRWCREQGLSVPGDLAIVGYDNTEAADFSSVPMTSVNYAAAEGQPARGRPHPVADGPDIAARSAGDADRPRACRSAIQLAAPGNRMATVSRRSKPSGKIGAGFKSSCRWRARTTPGACPAQGFGSAFR